MGSARRQGVRLCRALCTIIQNYTFTLMKWEAIGECWAENAIIKVLRTGHRSSKGKKKTKWENRGGAPGIIHERMVACAKR